MKHKFDMYQCVVLKKDVDQRSEVGLSRVDNVCKGTDGVVVDYLRDGGVAVELFDEEGWTIDVIFAPEACFRAATESEIERIQSRPPLNLSKIVTPNA